MCYEFHVDINSVCGSIKLFRGGASFCDLVTRVGFVVCREPRRI